MTRQSGNQAPSLCRALYTLQLLLQVSRGRWIRCDSRREQVEDGLLVSPSSGGEESSMARADLGYLVKVIAGQHRKRQVRQPLLRHLLLHGRLYSWRDLEISCVEPLARFQQEVVIPVVKLSCCRILVPGCRVMRLPL